ncbi:sensor histidine kinase [Streptomyces sp. NPDC001840]
MTTPAPAPREGPASPDPGAATAAPTPASGVRRGEKVLLRAYVLFRLGGLVQIAIAASTTWPRYRPLWAGLALVAVVFAESLALIAVALRRRRVPPRALVAADAVVMAGALVAGGALAGPAHGHTWTYFAYPFSLLASVGFGLVFTRPAAVLALASLPAAAYAVTAVTRLGDPVWNAVPNSVPYLVNAGIAWAVATTLLRTGRELDAATAASSAHQAQLATERERLRHARLLHDRVLQTMETLARTPWIADAHLHAQVRAEAAWLRAFVRGDHSAHSGGDLADGLTTLAEDMARIGQSVEVHTAQLRSAAHHHAAIPKEIADALVAAAREALTNVVKHAGGARAVVRAELTGDAVRVSVLDNGKGFDPAELPRGLGLTGSVRDRIGAVGGRTVVDSEPGAGTYVEMRVPLPRRASAEDRS